MFQDFELSCTTFLKYSFVMLKILPFFLCVSLWLNLSVIAQSIGKIPLYHSVYDNWKDLARPTISPDGQLITFEINPQKGDGFLHLQNLLKGRHDSISRGQEAVFSSTSDLFAFKIKQPEGLIHKLKLSKTKKEDLPKDSLGIFLVRTDSLIRIPRLKWFQIPKEGGSWMAYLQDKPKKIKDTLCVLDSCLSKAGLPKDSVPVKSQDASKNVKVKKLKKGAFDEVETSLLTITNPVTGAKFIFENVTEAAFSKRE